MKLMAIVLTYNESAHIRACLDSVAFADERLVVDSFSTDDTCTQARALGVDVVQEAFDNYATQRNLALTLAKARGMDWVLFVDADERVTPELAQEVREAIQHARVVGWRIPRFNYIFGKLTRGAGWYPDYQTRLLRVGRAVYDVARKVHEVVVLDGEEGTMAHHFIHYNYKDLAQFFQKQRKYVRYDAQMMYEAGIRPKPHNYILQPLRHFRWRFVTLKGYQDGWHGLRLSALMAWYEFRKYVVLGGLWRAHASK
jgi:glycosyltransferase involved in cell wall biosynthesis